ncbi:MAG: hypothetical protein AAF720_01830 [Pseudomonadota bacterium]
MRKNKDLKRHPDSNRSVDALDNAPIIIAVQRLKNQAIEQVLNVRSEFDQTS